MFKKLLLTVVLGTALFAAPIAPAYAGWSKPCEELFNTIEGRIGCESALNKMKIEGLYDKVNSLQRDIKISAEFQGVILSYLYLISIDPDNTTNYFNSMSKFLKERYGFDLDKYIKKGLK